MFVNFMKAIGQVSKNTIKQRRQGNKEDKETKTVSQKVN